jgi:tetratricopeptide (TPR) repeat protein
VLATAALLDSALGLGPRTRDGRTAIQLSHLSLRLGRMKQASDLALSALSAGPLSSADEAMAHQLLGEYYMSRRFWPAAAGHFREATLIDSSRSIHANNLAFALIQDGRTREAIGVLESALRRFPESPSLRKNLALALDGIGQADSALRVLDGVLTSDPDYPAALAARAELRARRGDLRRARIDLDDLVRIDPQSPAIPSVQQALAAATPARRDRDFSTAVRGAFPPSPSPVVSGKGSRSLPSPPPDSAGAKSGGS